MKSSLIAAMLISATAAQADGLYYGGGLSIVQGSSEESPNSATVSEDTYGAVTGTIGYRWDQSTMFFGAELGLDVTVGSDLENAADTCSEGANGPYYCNHVLTTRLRGVVGMPVGGFEGFATLGLASMGGTAANDVLSTGVAVNSGYTFGLGLQQDLNGNTLRYELIYDNLETNSVSQGGAYAPTFESVALSVSYLFN